MKTTFGATTQPPIRATFSKKKTTVLALLMFYETRADEIAYRVLSCVIYTIIKNQVCIDDIDYQPKHLSEIPVGYSGVSKHGDNVLTKYWVLELQIC